MTVEEFCLCLQRDCGVPPGAHVLAAVSGGADSTALLCFLCQARERLSITVSCAHMEHGIRGASSLEDMRFVRSLCERLHVPLYTSRAHAPAYAAEHGCGLEDAARRLRYAFLEETARQCGAEFIALAHHMGDQAETVLMHAARGSDLRGLGAMRMRRGKIIRPLLCAQPQELRAYLNAIGQSWREDESNADTAYARNHIRRLVMPALQAAYPGAQRALAQLAMSAQRDEDCFAALLSGLRVIALAGGAALVRSEVETMHEALLSRAVIRALEAAGLPVSAQSVDTAVSLLRGGKNAQAAIPGPGRVSLGRKLLCVTREGAREETYPLAMDAKTQTPFGTFVIRDAREGETGDGVRAQAIAQEKLAGAYVSARRPGDRMTPFGMRGEKKLQDILTDAGVERALRESVPVVRSGSGILWAAGVRASQDVLAQDGQRMKLVEFSSEWLDEIT